MARIRRRGAMGPDAEPRNWQAGVAWWVDRFERELAAGKPIQIPRGKVRAVVAYSRLIDKRTAWPPETHGGTHAAH